MDPFLNDTNSDYQYDQSHEYFNDKRSIKSRKTNDAYIVDTDRRHDNCFDYKDSDGNQEFYL